MQKTKMKFLAAALICMAAAGMGAAYAQTTDNTLTDSQFNLIIIATVIGVAAAPIVGYAGQVNTATTPATPFNWRQYSLALIVGIPTVLTLLLGELTATHAVVTGYVGTVVLFITAFIQGLGIDSLKSNISQAAQNK